MTSTVVSRWRAWWEALHEEHSDFIDRIPARWTSVAIIAASALTLYVEMLIVRWHATCFQAFAIFKNVSLLSCFLGLGIGYSLAGRRRITLASFLPLLGVQAFLFGLLSKTNLGGRRINPVAEQLIMGTAGSKWSWIHAVEGNIFLAAVFVLNALMFIPLGHLAGRLMGRLPKIRSYSLNVIGSLAGIILFFLLSLAWTPPSVWMGVAALTIAPFLIGHRRTVALGVGSMAIILIATGLMGDRREKQYYSPYQVIALRLPSREDPMPNMTIRVNHQFYQDILDSSPQAAAKAKKNAQAADYYNLPYRLQTEPGDVLVVGAGAGNDVAAALRHGARSVTAVEIDPAILFLGERLHPERPYQDPRTRIVLNDARTFLRQTNQRFDTVVYGLLDSQTNLGAMTNVRLDSFVYTLEGFRDAVRRLKNDGLLIVSYLLLDPRQGDNLYGMLQRGYPETTPRAFRNVGYGGTTFVTGPGLKKVPPRVEGIRDLTDGFLQSVSSADVATDDWPFFYMRRRTYPVSYVLMILVLLLLSGWLVRRHLGTPQMLGYQHGVFFFLGAGFMLIETKGITELGLVFGNTWLVIGVVITGILLMVFLANQWVLWRGPVRHGVSFTLLAGSLLLGLALAHLSATGVVIPWAKLVMPVALTLPLLFAGLIFSSELTGRGDIGEILSANLFGAMLGGFLEYNSMYWGYSSLYPLGMGLYALAFLCKVRANQVLADSLVVQSAPGPDLTG
jgi:spermidine synthase